MTIPPKPEHALAGIRALLEPTSIAVIGASRQRDKVGGQVLHNLMRYGFTGPVYPVNPTARVVQSMPAYPSMDALPDGVDLVIIAVPAPEVLAAAEAAIRRGARALVVLSAGFGEAGAAGKERQDALLRLCRTAGVRLVGPNCLGLVNTNPAVRLNALFSPIDPPAGAMAFASQSGALGLAAMQFAAERQLGFSSFVSMGNKADVSSNDLLEYWEQDPNTRVILLYLESFGNPRKFSQIVQRVARTKPVIAVKSGRSAAGQRAAASHTGAMLASSDITVDALFRQAGVIRVETLRELFDVAACLAHQPLPRGRSIGVVTNVGGPGIMCADACEAHGLRVPELAIATQEALRSMLPAEASVRNPVDMIATATAGQFDQAMRAVAADPEVDALMPIFLQPLTTQPEAVAAAIRSAAAALDPPKPVLAVFMQPGGPPQGLHGGGIQVPDYPFPEEAVIAYVRAAAYAEWRTRPPTTPAHPAGTDLQRAHQVLATAVPSPEGWLSPADASALLSAHGLPLVHSHAAPDEGAAARLAETIGGTVVLKAVAPGLVHKSDIGGVKLGLRSAAEVERAAGIMRERLQAAGHPLTGYLVQPQLSTGIELFAGVVHDRHFGPLLAVGAGGVLVELLGDVAVRLAPLSERDAWEMLQSLRSYPLLTGYRGSLPLNAAAMVDVLLRLSLLANEHEQVAELDCNPVVVTAQGAHIVDLRVRLFT